MSRSRTYLAYTRYLFLRAPLAYRVFCKNRIERSSAAKSHTLAELAQNKTSLTINKWIGLRLFTAPAKQREFTHTGLCEDDFPVEATPRERSQRSIHLENLLRIFSTSRIFSEVLVGRISHNFFVKVTTKGMCFFMLGRGWFVSPALLLFVAPG